MIYLENKVGLAGNLGNFTFPIEDQSLVSVSETQAHSGGKSIRLVGKSGSNSTEFELLDENGNSLDLDFNPEHKYYISAAAYQDTAVGETHLMWPSRTAVFEPLNIQYGAWTVTRAIVQQLRGSGSTSPVFYFVNGGDVGYVYLDSLVIADLTEAYGVGYEPDEKTLFREITERWWDYLYLPDPAPLPVENLTATKTDSAIELSWSKSKYAESYAIYENGIRIDRVTTTTASIGGNLVAARTFEVRAEGSSGIAEGAFITICGLITDRTISDVLRWKELQAKGWAGMTSDEQSEWLAGMKGAYNATDLNRVGETILKIRDRMESYGYSVSVNAKTDWAMSDIPTPAQMVEYLWAVCKMRQSIPVFSTTPNAPNDMEKLTYAEANDIEKILLDITLILDLIAEGWYQSNEVYSGEV